MAIKFVLNETSYFGDNARENLALEIQKRNFKKVFLVSDKSLVEAGVTAKVEKILSDAGIVYDLYDEIKPNPTINPKLTAKDVAARDFRSILPLKYSAYTGRNPSLYTATFLFAKIDDMAPIPAANK